MPLESFHCVLMEVEMSDLQKYINRVQEMLNREEESRLKERETLTAQKQIISDIFADNTPQVFYTSCMVMLCSLLERSINRIVEALPLRKLAPSEGYRLNFIEKFHLQYDGRNSAADDHLWESMVGWVRLRNRFVHGALSPDARSFTLSRGIQIWSKSETKLGISANLDDPQGDLVWIYYSDVEIFLTEARQFLDAIYQDAFSFQNGSQGCA